LGGLNIFSVISVNARSLAMRDPDPKTTLREFREYFASSYEAKHKIAGRIGVSHSFDRDVFADVRCCFVGWNDGCDLATVRAPIHRFSPIHCLIQSRRSVLISSSNSSVV
jgi:hypothetical protein